MCVALRWPLGFDSASISASSRSRNKTDRSWRSRTRAASAPLPVAKRKPICWTAAATADWFAPLGDLESLAADGCLGFEPLARSRRKVGKMADKKVAALLDETARTLPALCTRRLTRAT